MLTSLDRTRRSSIDRSGDRRVALAGVTIALGFLAAALLSLALPAESRRGLWLPLHLALAGGAATAIAGVMPFFVAAFAAAPPAGVALRAAAVVCVATGAIGVVVGVISTTAVVALAGGSVFLLGIGLIGAATVKPVAGALGPSRGLVTRAYLATLSMVAAGALLATLDIGGVGVVASAWPRLKPAHAWLNLIGFASLGIATTLLHFWPTVVGARIAAHRSARITLVALGVAPPTVGIGYALDSDLAVQAGSAVAMAAALALVVYVARIWSVRARWTTDPGWHRFAIGGLASAIGWFVVGMAILTSRTLAAGAAPEGWAIDPVIGPLVVGWVGLAILASATHLVAAVGPGGPAAHARQRSILGEVALVRLISLDLGVLGISIGLLVGSGSVASGGATIVAIAATATLLLFGRAIAVGLRSPRDRPQVGGDP